MFGYIRPLKPHMRFCEYDIYSAFYCGLCKNLGRKYGQFFRLLLSYDFAFLGILSAAYNNAEIKVRRQRCIAHPFKKRPCLCDCETIDYATGAAVISVYHKICDSIEDSGFFEGIFFRFVKMLANKGYKKASMQYPELSKVIEEQMKEQFYLEKEKCSSLDCACEPTAKIMSAIAEGIGEDDMQKQELSGFGYHLGRFVYIADAYDDLQKDIKKGNYNPLVENCGVDAEKCRKFGQANINMTLGMIAEYYSRMNVNRFKEIIDNVIYLGLVNFKINKKGKSDKKEYKI